MRLSRQHKKYRQGQSLIELIVALAIGVILVVGAVAAIAPILRISGNVARIQTASALGKQLLENARVLAESNWHAVNNLSTGSSNRYYVIASTSPFTVATGTESVLVSTTTYTRFFYLDNVSRTATAPFAPTSTGVSDPSTKKITVVYAWPPNASNTIVSYLTRSGNEVLSIEDWSGGGQQDGPVTATTVNARFATSSGIDYITHDGAITIQGF